MSRASLLLCFALGAFWLLLAVGCGETGGSVEAGGPPPAAEQASLNDAWNQRGGAAITWTDRGLFVFGGRSGTTDEFLRDGYLVAPNEQEPQPLAPSPFAFPIMYARSVAIDDGVFVFGTACERRPDPESEDCDPGTWEVAIYRLATGDWRAVELPPELAQRTNAAASFPETLPDGRVVLELREPHATGAPSAAPLWIYDPEADRWTQLPSPGVRIENWCLADEHLVVVTGTVQRLGGASAGPSDPPITHDLFLDPELRIYDTDGQAGWEEGPVARGVENDYVGPQLACGGERVIMVDPDLGGEALLVDLDALDRGVIELPDLPRDFLVTSALWTGESILLVDTQRGVGQALDTSSQQWRPTVAPRGEHARWTGDSVVTIRPTSGQINETEITP